MVDTADNLKYLDVVVYDTYGLWPALTSGYSYELKNLVFDNAEGGNWEPSCNAYGTPGYGRVTTCSATCDDTRCALADASATCINGTCNCSPGYYSSNLDCLLLPAPSNCFATYTPDNNGGINVIFEWEKPGLLLNGLKYKYYYYESGGGNEPAFGVTSVRTKTITDFDISRDKNLRAGYVYSLLGDVLSIGYANCSANTLAPTTPSPTTPSPISNAYAYFSGDLCKEDRCDCAGQGFDSCGMNNDNSVGKVFKEYLLSILYIIYIYIYIYICVCVCVCVYC